MRKLLLCFLFSMPLWAQIEEVPGVPCQDCHSPLAWSPLAEEPRFDHGMTNFPLAGAHLHADCIQCHPGRDVPARHAFREADPQCSACHLDIHQGLYPQDCSTCHNPGNWDLTQNHFDHDRTLFPLTGAHRVLPCVSCHLENIAYQSRFVETRCIRCHEDVYLRARAAGHQENEDCVFCHNNRSWIPVDMSQHDSLFPIYSGSHRGVWTSCNAQCHPNSNNYADFSCGLNGVCHAHDRSRMDSKHREEGGSAYRYDSSACFRCHPRGTGGD